MKNSSFAIVLIVLSLLIAYLICLNFFPKTTEEIRVTETERVSSSRLQALEGEVANLRIRINNLEKRPEVSRTATTAHSPRPTKPSPSPAVATTAEPEMQPDKKADLSHIRNVSGEIIFCVMANNDGGMHFPQYALERGVTFNGIRSNTTDDGNNWVVNPTETIRGDYGVTAGGTFFVSHEVIESTMSESLINIGIKAGFTGWQAKEMKREGRYWIYKTR